MANTDAVQAVVDGAKVASVWTAVGISSWGDVASAAAAVYTLLLMGDWIWKKALRPFLEKHGIVERRLRRKHD